MYVALKELGINNNMINMSCIMLQKTKMRIKNWMSGKFEVKEGVRQGDPLSCILFNLILEKIIREEKIKNMAIP